MAAGPVFMRGKGCHVDIQAAHAAIWLRFTVGGESCDRLRCRTTFP